VSAFSGAAGQRPRQTHVESVGVSAGNSWVLLRHSMGARRSSLGHDTKDYDRLGFSVCATARPMSMYLFALVDGGGTVPPELGAVTPVSGEGSSRRRPGRDSMVDEVAATGGTFSAMGPRRSTGLIRQPSKTRSVIGMPKIRSN